MCYVVSITFTFTVSRKEFALATRALATMQTLNITVPPGISAGQKLTVQAPDGQMMQIVVPPNTFSGQQLQVQLPKSLPKAATPPAPQEAKHKLRDRMSRSLTRGIELTSPTVDDSRLETLMGWLRDANVQANESEAHAALQSCSDHVGRAFKQLKASKSPGQGITLPSGSDDPLADPLGDLLAGNIFLVPPVYDDHEEWARKVEVSLGAPVWETELKPPVIDLLEVSSVPVSNGFLAFPERVPISQVLTLLEGDATSNSKLRLLQEQLSKLPPHLSRTQAEALLRCFDIPMRRVQALELIRSRLAHADAAWADEIPGATSERIRSLCGDAPTRR